MNYRDKLKDPRWQRKRLEVLQRDSFTCCHCGDDKNELHIHHLKYSGDPWEAEMDDMITVCRHCHSIVEVIKPILPDAIVKQIVRIGESSSWLSWAVILNGTKKPVAFFSLIDGRYFMETVVELTDLKNIIKQVENL